MVWTFCPDLGGFGGWAAHAGTIPPGSTYPVDNTNDPDLTGFIPAGGGEIDLISGTDTFNPCTWVWGDVDFVAYYSAAGGYAWQPMFGGLGGTEPSGTDLYVFSLGPNYDATDPEPTWDPAEALGWLFPPPPTGEVSSITWIWSSFGRTGVHDPGPDFCEPGDLFFAQLVGTTTSGGSLPTLPAGWTVIHSEDSTNARWVIGYRFVPVGYSIADEDLHIAEVACVNVYRGVDRADPIAAFSTGSVEITELNSVLLDCVFEQSFVTYLFDEPDGETLRYGGTYDPSTEHQSPVGQAMADTAGLTTLLLGTRAPTAWTRDVGTALPTTPTQALVVLRAAGLGGWGVGMIRMGAN